MYLAVRNPPGHRRGGNTRKGERVGRVYEEGEGELTLGILVWAVDVVTPHYDDGEFEALLVRVDQHLGGGFAGSVRVGRGQYAGLEQVVVIVLDFAVDLVGGDVDESTDADLLGALEKDVGAVHVGVGESIRIAEAQVDVGLGGEVEDGVDVVALEAVYHHRKKRKNTKVEAEVTPIVKGAGVVERRAGV